MLIDSRHRLRPERIINGRASLLQDIKQTIISLWRGFIYVFCCLAKAKKKQTIDVDDDDEQQDEQRKPLLNNQ